MLDGDRWSGASPPHPFVFALKIIYRKIYAMELKVFFSNEYLMLLTNASTLRVKFSWYFDQDLLLWLGQSKQIDGLLQLGLQLLHHHYNHLFVFGICRSHLCLWLWNGFREINLQVWTQHSYSNHLPNMS